MDRLSNHVHPVQPAAAQNSQGETFDVVDAHDQVIGTASRGEVHDRGPVAPGRPHPGFQLPRRVVPAETFPLEGQASFQMDSSARGHLDTGETYAEAARRELTEELGLPSAAVADNTLEQVGWLPATESTGWEFVHVFRCRHEGPFRWPGAEIEWGGFFPVATVRTWAAAHPEDFAPGFLKCWALPAFADAC